MLGCTRDGEGKGGIGNEEVMKGKGETEGRRNGRRGEAECERTGEKKLDNVDVQLERKN